jgi:hypothetical protein
MVLVLAVTTGNTRAAGLCDDGELLNPQSVPKTSANLHNMRKSNILSGQPMSIFLAKPDNMRKFEAIWAEQDRRIETFLCLGEMFERGGDKKVIEIVISYFCNASVMPGGLDRGGFPPWYNDLPSFWIKDIMMPPYHSSVRCKLSIPSSSWGKVEDLLVFYKKKSGEWPTSFGEYNAIQSLFYAEQKKRDKLNPERRERKKIEWDKLQREAVMLHERIEQTMSIIPITTSKPSTKFLIALDIRSMSDLRRQNQKENKSIVAPAVSITEPAPPVIEEVD